MARSVSKLAEAIARLESDLKSVNEEAVVLSNEINALAEDLAAKKREEIRSVLRLALEELERIATEEEEKVKEWFEHELEERIEDVQNTAINNMDRAVNAVFQEIVALLRERR